MTGQLSLIDEHDDDPVTERWAQLSPCGTYRYLLGRRWDEGPALRWIMLNPSTADAEIDDPTIRRVINFTHAAGYRCAIVANLFALRATDPKALRSHPDPVGPQNDAYLVALRDAALVEALRCDRWPAFVAAWGANAPAGRVAKVVELLRPARLMCVGVTRHGHPRHPLYVRADQPFAPWGPR